MISNVIKGVVVIVLIFLCLFLARFVAFGYFYVKDDCIYHGPLAEDIGPCGETEASSISENDSTTPAETYVIKEDEYSTFKKYEARDFSLFYPADWTVEEDDTEINIVPNKIDATSPVKEGLILKIIKDTNTNLTAGTCDEITSELASQLKSRFDLFEIKSSELVSINELLTCYTDANLVLKEEKGKYIRYYITDKKAGNVYVFETRYPTGSDNMDLYDKVAKSFQSTK